MKRTIFEGTVNGEKFDNVQDYNARVKELMESGQFESASSSTRVEEYEHSGYVRAVEDDSHCDCGCDCDECTCTCTEQLPWEDDDLSFYPYLDKDDPLYLDLLVTDHRETNREALAEVSRVFEKCKRYIIDALEDPDTDIESKKNYLEDIKEIVEDLAADKKDTLEAIKKVEKKAEDLENEYKEKFLAIDRDRFILEESRPVIDAFLDFYRGVESDIILNIKENTHKPKMMSQKSWCSNRNDVNNNKKTITGTITGVDVDNRIDTGIRESQPQRVDDLQSILDRIFGPFRGVK
jgi:hypothetical protein